MKLRTRLLVTTFIAAVPLVVSLLWYERRTRYSMIEASLEASVNEVMRGDALEACERAPERFAPNLPPNPMLHRRGPGRGFGMGALRGSDTGLGAGPGFQGGGAMQMRLYPYDRDFRSQNADSPELERELMGEIRSGRSIASRPIDLDGRAGFEALVTVPGGNACAYVLVRRPIPAVLSSTPFQLRTSIAWLFPSLGLLVAVYLGLGLLVRRVTRLTSDVRASTQAAYAELPNDDSNDEIAELRRAFIEAGREIQTQLATVATKERILREFLANTTHDVMLPLTVLQGYLAAMAEKPHQAGAPGGEALAGALRESHYIGALLRNLALTAKLDGKQPDGGRETFDLAELVARAVARHQFLAKQQHVELNHSVPEKMVHVIGESVAVEQAVSNVIYNAVAYNRRGGHVAVLLESIDAMAFLLRVTDDGPGVSDEELTRLSERHYRGDHARSRSQGGGLGLNIAERVSQMHGWSMTIAASDSGGLEVAFKGTFEPLCDLGSAPISPGIA